MPTPIGMPDTFGAVLRSTASPTIESVERETRSERLPNISDAVTAKDSEGFDFNGRVRQFVEVVNNDQMDAEKKARAFARGEDNDLHGTMIALQKADISLRLISTVKNRLIEAYREIQRMGA